MFINTQKLFKANLAAKLTILLLAEQIIDVVTTQLMLNTGTFEVNPLFAAQFNETHTVIQFSLIGKFALPLLLFPLVYFAFARINGAARLDRVLRRFLIASIFAINVFYMIILSWNIGLFMKICFF